MDLFQLECEACHSGDPSLTNDEVNRWFREVPRWEVNQVDGIKRLERVFSFRSFSQAMVFAARVGKLAEEHRHHPRILIEYDKVTLSWWTHKVRGLHLNDFIMAAKVDHLLKLHPPE